MSRNLRSPANVKFILAIASGLVLAGCTQANESPDLARVGNTLFIRGMALGITTTASAEKERQVSECRSNETLAAITGPVDYCRLRNTEFGGVETTVANVLFNEGRLTSIHINAPSTAFGYYAAMFQGALGEPKSPLPDAQGIIPNGEANIIDGQRRHVLSDYRIWDTPVAYVSLYEKASGKTGQLQLMIQARFHL